MSVSNKVIELRNRITGIIIQNYDYGDDVIVLSVGMFDCDQGGSHINGEYKISLVLKEGDEVFEGQMEIIFAPGSDEVYEAFVINTDAGGIVGESIVDNPDLIQHWVKSAKAA